MRKDVTIKNRNEEVPIPVEIIAESIKEIAEGMRKIRASRLNTTALNILISRASGVGINEIERVLGALDNFGGTVS